MMQYVIIIDSFGFIYTFFDLFGYLMDYIDLY